MSASNGKPRMIRTTPVILAIGIALGALPGGVAGVMWNNWALRSLEGRFNIAVTRFDALKTAFEAEVERERNEDQRLTLEISDAQRNVAALQASVPARLPALHEIIEQSKVIDAINGRLDEVNRRLNAKDEQITRVCGVLAGISAASAKKAGC